MQTRVEVDSLGEKLVPKSAYYGIQTLRAVENFPVSGLKAPTVFVQAYVLVKRAAAAANMQVEWLNHDIGNAIIKACDEVLAGKFLDEFVIDVFQAGAGTSFNMNVNEVLANRALETLGHEKGEYKTVSPNDHVNMAQSSNDTFPTALHVAGLLALHPLLTEIDKLSKAFERLAKKYSNTVKSGRTHLQDALPLVLGQEFGAYAATLKKTRRQIETSSKHLEEVALGATAVGTGANAHPDFKKIVIAELRRMTGLKLKVAKDPFEALQSRNAIAAVSGALKELALELIRIANDLRLLSSGPTTGLAEIQLPPVQPGSSIIPGKVNPVMAECLDMICFQIVGNDLAISFAVQAGQLELNVMTPVMMHNILQSIQLLANYLPVFREKCVEGIKADVVRCKDYVKNNPSLAVFLSPVVGYLEAAKIANQAMMEKKSVRSIVLEKGIIGSEQARRIFDPKFLIGRAKTRERVDG